MPSNKTEIRPLRSDDLEDLYRIRQIAFLDNMSVTDPAIQATHQDTLAYKYGRFVGKRLASSASWYPFTMYIGGEQTTVGGLASVVSAAESRRQGHVRALLSHGLEMLRDDGVGWCLEYPFDTRYYRRFGWETVANGTILDVPIERFVRFGRPSSIRRVQHDDATAAEAIRRIYGNWAANYNFTMARDGQIRPDWERILAGTPWQDDTRFVFLADHAYCVCKLTSKDRAETLHLLDYAFETPSGRQTLFAFMNNFAGQVDSVRLQLATDDPLRLEWSNFAVAHPHPLHARIVDAASALSGRTATEGAPVVIAVVDDFCDWNNARFQIDVEAGRTVATKVDTSPDVEIDIRALAQILSGSVSAPAATQMGLLEGSAASAERLCRLASRPCYMPLADYF